MEPSPQRSDASGGSRNGTAFRIWLDTLCCPTQLETKAMVLGKMAAIYTNAAHVLVLDACLMQISKRTSPAEILLRHLSMSPWMSRMWTLREGALASSLYFQLAEGAVRVHKLRAKISELCDLDIRYMAILHDVTQEVRAPKFPGMDSR
jgi:hypothetical protein